jgi:RimJ/RimL family protein N-acetyltransferase
VTGHATTPALELAEVTDDDLPFLFAIQRDPVSNHMADVAPRDAEAFAAHWVKIRNDPVSITRIIRAGGEQAGLILSFLRDGVRELGYWIDQSHWGRGIASGAVAAFLSLDPYRPLTARVVKDNAGSIRVLERNGFVRTGESTEDAWYRGGTVELWVYELMM